MRRVTWSGNVPADEGEARRRIIDAAVRCVRRHGLERTSTALIADDVGVSRPTLYAYFENRDEIIQQAVLLTTEAFLQRVLARQHEFDTAAERLVEGTLYSAREIRHEPGLAAHFRAGNVPHGPLTGQEVYFARLALGPVVELSPQLADWLDEAAELAARVFISLLTRDPVVARGEAADRAFLHRWWPRAMGLAEVSEAARR